MVAAEVLGLHIGTFLAWTSGVAFVTWFICTRLMGSGGGAVEDYFAGGRALGWYVVAGSLMLTNLSTEQLVGLNGNIFTDGCLAATAWETFAALAMCVTAGVFLPRYMQTGLMTSTGFLGERFDRTTRTLVSLVFLVYYAIGLCPSVLYTGALAIRNIFDLDDVPLWAVCVVVGVIGACYAIFGGLKAVAVSDCLNGLGLVVVGFWVPIAALQKIGGLSGLFEDAEPLRPLVARSDVYDPDTGHRKSAAPSMPWHVLLTGTMLVNLYYWSMNQLIVQRALAAKSLAQGQKGVLFAAAMKVVGFTFLCLPGVIGMIMVRRGVEVDGKPFKVEKADEVYPEMVKAVMPTWALGFFAAVLLGSILSTFNSALNSASTLFGLDIYRVYINPEASEERVVKVASAFGASLTVLSLAIAPQLQRVDSIFEFLQRVKSIASLPILTIFLVGIYTVRPDAFSAKFAFAVGCLAYGACQFVPKDEVNFLHTFFACFILALASMALAAFAPPLRRCFRQHPEPTAFVLKAAPKVSVTPWPWMVRVVVAIFALVALLTISLQVGSLYLFVTFWVLWVLALAVLMALPSGDSTAATAGGAPEEAAKNTEDSETGSVDADPECPTAQAIGVQSSGERGAPSPQGSGTTVLGI